MARPATGSLRWLAERWEVRVTLASGKRSKPIAMIGLSPCLVSPSDPERGCACTSCETARAKAGEVSDYVRVHGVVPDETAETANEWFDRYHAYAKELGQTDAEKKRSRWTKWIAPKIGHKPMALVTRDDIEDIRDALDAAIAAWKRDGANRQTITGKTAMNAWSCLTSSFKAATSSKRRDLRVLDGRTNPCLGVEPPGDRSSRQVRRKTFLYPKEAATLLACEAIEIEWRELYALALFTYLRPGELRVLTWADVDLDAGLIHVTKAWDYAEEKIKPPKTRNGVRRVPIDPNLAPLLRRLRKSKPTTALVTKHLDAFGERHLALRFRAHLEAAGLTRAELHTSTRTHVQSNFRSCRDSGITWLAMNGLGVDKIMRRAGHDDIATSLSYCKAVEDLTGDLGQPFPALPPSLVTGTTDPGPESLGGVSVFRSRKTPKTPSNQWAQRDLNPAESRPDSASESAREAEKIGRSAIVESTAQSPVLVAESTAETVRSDPDEALKMAIKVAIDGGDYARAEALLAVLRASPKPAPVVAIVPKQAR